MIDKYKDYYGKEAYSQSCIPQQCAAKRRSLLKKLVGVRLPWGNTEDVVIDDLMEHSSPKEMRFWAQVESDEAEQKAAGSYEPRPFDDVELHWVYDHQRFRFAQLPARSQIWLIVLALCKGAVIFMAPLAVIVDALIALDESWNFGELIENSVAIWVAVIFAPSWLLLDTIVNRFPKFWFCPPRGPLWELNRATGLVTIFNKPVKGIDNTVGGFIAPFYEFDAYMVTIREPQGFITYGLVIAHRYSNYQINLRPILVPGYLTPKPCALWDFFQNYMDIQKPLPDIPMFEAYRHLDPVTAEHDKKTGRNPRYWFDMDNETFAQKVKEMQARVSAINTLQRPNMMAKYVRYVD